MAETKKETKKAVIKISNKPPKEQKEVLKSKFAVISISGVQLKVYEGKEYEISKIAGNKGDKKEISEVLLFVNDNDIKIGNPFVNDIKVLLEITSQIKGKKINGLKYKAKSRYRKHFGSRPLLTKVLVKKIG